MCPRRPLLSLLENLFQTFLNLFYLKRGGSESNKFLKVIFCCAPSNVLRFGVNLAKI